jgi:hypothetical protein
VDAFELSARTTRKYAADGFERQVKSRVAGQKVANYDKPLYDKLVGDEMGLDHAPDARASER